MISFLVLPWLFRDSASISVLSAALEKQNRRDAVWNWRELGLFAELESRRQERPSVLHKNSMLFTELGTQ